MFNWNSLADLSSQYTLFLCSIYLVGLNKKHQKKRTVCRYKFSSHFSIEERKENDNNRRFYCCCCCCSCNLPIDPSLVDCCRSCIRLHLKETSASSHIREHYRSTMVYLDYCICDKTVEHMTSPHAFNCPLLLPDSGNIPGYVFGSQIYCMSKSPFLLLQAYQPPLPPSSLLFWPALHTRTINHLSLSLPFSP